MVQKDILSIPATIILKIDFKKIFDSDFSECFLETFDITQLLTYNPDIFYVIQRSFNQNYTS
jgi:hypothetical protein